MNSVSGKGGVKEVSITAKELAKKLNLSEAAVSLSLNNKPGVSTQTRKRVWNAAQELGYDFSRRAAPRMEFKGTICLVIYKKSGAVVADTPFFSSLTEGVLVGCKKCGYELVIRHLYEDENLDNQLYLLESAKFAGIIVLATEMNLTSMQPFARLKTPLVILDSYFDTLPYDCVLINNIQGAFIATDYLINKKKKQPGYMHSAYSISNFEERADGFYKAIRFNGMSTSKCIVHHLTPSQEGACADMKALIEAGEELAPCYFADNDYIAVGAITALKQAGYRIPEDIAVIGFDDLPLCEYLSPPLTTIHVPKQYLGETAARRMAQIIETKSHTPVKTEVSTTLVKRRSV